MFETLTYTYLILPLCFILNKGKFKHRILVLLAIYGILFFGLLKFWDPDSSNLVTNNYYQGSYTLLEYSIFTYIFWYNIQSKPFRKLIIVVSLLFLLYQFFYVTSATFARLDSISIGIETILIFIYIFYFFYEFSKNTKDVFIYNHYGFWLAVGIMIYLGGSFFFYIIINNLDQNEIEKFSKMTFIAEIIKNLLFAFSIFLYRKFPINKIQTHPKKIPNLDMNMI